MAALSGGLSPHEDCLAEDVFVNGRGVAEWSESSKRDERMSSGVVARAFGSPSFARAWMQKEPRQCPPRWIDTDRGDVGLPNYRSRLVVRELKKTVKKSDVPTAAELFSGMPILESVKALLSPCSSDSQEEARSKRNPCDVRHQPCALSWSTGATRVCGIPA